MHAELAALGASASAGLAHHYDGAALPHALPVCAMPTGVALHDAAHGRVGVVLDGEKGLLHGSFLLLSFGEPFLAGFEAGLAWTTDENGVRDEVACLLYAEKVVFFVANDTVFLLLCHGLLIVFVIKVADNAVNGLFVSRGAGKEGVVQIEAAFRHQVFVGFLEGHHLVFLGNEGSAAVIPAVFVGYAVDVCAGVGIDFCEVEFHKSILSPSLIMNTS